MDLDDKKIEVGECIDMESKTDDLVIKGLVCRTSEDEIKMKFGDVISTMKIRKRKIRDDEFNP